MNRRELTIKTTQAKEIIDITDTITEIVTPTYVVDGLLHIFVMHTTAAITTADLDPGTDLDMLDAFEEMIPRLSYRHPHDPSHVPDHILSSLIGTTLTVPLKDNELVLGTWQRIVLIEFNGPRECQLLITICE